MGGRWIPSDGARTYGSTSRLKPKLSSWMSRPHHTTPRSGSARRQAKVEEPREEYPSYETRVEACFVEAGGDVRWWWREGSLWSREGRGGEEKTCLLCGGGPSIVSIEGRSALTKLRPLEVTRRLGASGTRHSHERIQCTLVEALPSRNSGIGRSSKYTEGEEYSDATNQEDWLCRGERGDDMELHATRGGRREREASFRDGDGWFRREEAAAEW
ncbi:hypothetical protein R3P38DRAFT_69583 [Favolaschia claudopus]|uniref:Uncharacterized protein n=1 Tax=Favolaschia claudopus TaxID=2862362 RepID=A0AAW0D5S7_9AGAR